MNLGNDNIDRYNNLINELSTIQLDYNNLHTHFEDLMRIQIQVSKDLKAAE